MIKFLCSVVLFCFLSTTHAQNWVKIASTDTNDFYILEKSLVTTKDFKNSTLVVTTGMIIDVKKSKSDIYIWVVSANDCSLKRGKLMIHDSAGKYIDQYDFYFDNKIISSIIAEVMCLSVIKNSDPKFKI